MGKYAFTNARVISPLQTFPSATVLVDKGRVMEVVQGPLTHSGDWETIDLSGHWLVPGFIDLHVHGGAGADTMDGTADAIAQLADAHLKGGTTTILPTTVTHGREETLAAIHAVKELMSKPEYTGRILGIHLEGPYICPHQKGAHREDHIRAPKVSEWMELLADPAVVRLITLAPEVDGAEELVRHAVQKGIRVAVGHSNASYDQVVQAMHWGATQITHIYNAMRGLHHRDPGVVGAALTLDQLWAQLIPDGVHVHSAAMNVVMRCKGAEKTILVTDSLRATGLPTGVYDLGGQEVIVSDDAVRLPSGNLAGSKLTMANAVRNMVRMVGISLQDAVRMATLTPAEAMGIDRYKGSLQVGRDADLVVLDDTLEVKQVWVKGARVS